MTADARNEIIGILRAHLPGLDQEALEATVVDLARSAWADAQLAAAAARSEVVAYMVAHLDGLERSGLLGYIDARRLRTYVTGLDSADIALADRPASECQDRDTGGDPAPLEAPAGVSAEERAERLGARLQAILGYCTAEGCTARDDLARGTLAQGGHHYLRGRVRAMDDIAERIRGWRAAPSPDAPAEIEGLQARAEKAEAEVALMRPVVEAADAAHDEGGYYRCRYPERGALASAVRAYRAAREGARDA